MKGGENMKKSISFILVAVVLFSVFATVVSASNEGIMPCFNNAANVRNAFIISDNIAIVSLSYVGYSGITSGAKITTTLQKRTLLLFWSDVIEWVDTSSAVSYSFEHTHPVSSGTYRVKITYEISGTGGATDIIEDEIKVKN